MRKEIEERGPLIPDTNASIDFSTPTVAGLPFTTTRILGVVQRPQAEDDQQ
jgi:hypothetical protein